MVMLNKRIKRLRIGKEIEGDKGDQEEEMISELSMDVLADILMRLDVKSLSQLRCVCKSWNKLISDSSFKKLHREKSFLKDHPPYVLFVEYSWTVWERDNLISFTIVDNLEGRLNGSSTTTCCFPVPSSEPILCSYPVCCDLFCVSTRKNVYLFNPRMKQVYTLPFLGYRSILGFGYTASKGAYVLVSLCRETWVDKESTELVGEVRGQIFSFNVVEDHSSSSIRISPCHHGSSGWRAIKENSPRWTTRSAGGGILVGTSMHWLMNKYVDNDRPNLFLSCQRRSNELILTLDIENEKFDIISCPQAWQSLSIEDDLLIRLIDLKGTLCVTDLEALRKTSVLEIWALTSRHNNDTNNTDRAPPLWVKECSIKLNTLLPSFRTAEFPWMMAKSSRDGEVILPAFYPGKFYLCNIYKRSIRKVKGPVHSDSVGFFWDSFLSLETS